MDYTALGYPIITACLASLFHVFCFSTSNPVLEFLEGQDLARFAGASRQACLEVAKYANGSLLHSVRSLIPVTSPLERLAVSPGTRALSSGNVLRVFALLHGGVRCSLVSCRAANPVTYEPAIGSRGFARQLTGPLVCDACMAATGDRDFALDLVDKSIAAAILENQGQAVTMAMATTSVMVQVPAGLKKEQLQAQTLILRYYPNITFSAYLTVIARPFAIFVRDSDGREFVGFKPQLAS